MRTAIVTALITGVACGGAKRPSEGVVDMAAARASVEQVDALAAAMPAMNGHDAAVAIEALIIAHQALVTPSGNLDELRGELYPYLMHNVMFPSTGAVCTAASCTFTGYGFGVTYLVVTLDGTVTRSGDSIALDITHDVVEHTASMSWAVESALSVTADGIDGTAHSHATGSRGYAGLTWDVVVEYRGVVRDAQGCPIGGSLHTVTRYDVLQDDQNAGSYPSFEVEGTAAFGPTCQ